MTEQKKFDLQTLHKLPYTITLPESSDVVTLRHMTARDHVDMEQGKDPAEIISRCITSGRSLDDFSIADSEYLILKMHQRSHGNIIKAQFNCCAIDSESTITEKTPDEILLETPEESIEAIFGPAGISCGQLIDVDIDLDQVYVPAAGGLSELAIGDSGVTLHLKHPSITDYDGNSDTPEGMFKLVCASIESVSVEGEVWSRDDLGDQLLDVIGNLTASDFTKLIGHVDDGISRVQIDVLVECPKCGNSEDVCLKGLDEIFI